MRSFGFHTVAPLLILLTCNYAAAEPVLRQGHAFSEAAAREKLAEMARQVDDAEGWNLRAERIRENIYRGARLEKLPEPCPLKVIRHSLRKMDGYTVENVAFEALPGFFVTGNLYLPLEYTGEIPGVLAPHGHLENKRRHESTQHRCASMARMGAAVFAWDMFGVW